MGRGERAALIFILLLAAYARLNQLGVSHFLGDEALLSRLALDTLYGELPDRGTPASLGAPTPPTMAFVMAIPMLFSKNLIFGLAWVGLWNVLGVAWLYAITRAWLSWRVALIAALLYAASPWATHYSRQIFPPDLHIPFMLGGLWLAFTGIRERSRWKQALCIPFFLVTVHIHYAAAVLIPLLGFVLALGWRRLSPSAIAAGIVIAGLTLIPFWVGLTQDDLQALRDLRHGADTGSDSQGQLSPQRTLNLIAGLDVEEELLNDADPTDLYTVAPRPTAFWLLLVGFTILGGVASLWAYRRMAPFLIYWAGVLVVATASGLVTVPYHYLILSLPVFMILAGVGCEWLMRWRPLNIALPPLLVLIAMSQAVWLTRALSYVDGHFTHSGYSTPLHYLTEINTALAEYPDVVLIGGQGRTGLDVWKPLLYDKACLRTPEATEMFVAVFPAHPHEMAALLTPNGYGNLRNPIVLEIYQDSQETLFPLREGESPYRLYTDIRPIWTGPEIIKIDSPPFDTGAQLLGYALTPDSLLLEWSLNTQEAPDYKLFVHFLDDAAQRLGQYDGDFWPGSAWCRGDRIITGLDTLTLPAETTHLRIGMYQLQKDGGFINANLLDNAGQWVDIPIPTRP